MNRNRSVVWLREVRLNYFEKLVYDFLWRIRTIDEEEVIMLDSRVHKVISIILHIVEANHFIDSYVIEYLNILPWMLAVSMLRISVLNGAHESDKLARYDPIEVAILDSLVVFVFFDIKCPKIIPAKPHGVLEALQTMKQCAIVEAFALGRVTIVLHDWMVGLELRVGIFRLHLKYDYHECAHEESTVDEFVARIL